MSIEGFYNIKPVIKKITFLHKGKFDLHLEDGRIISAPVSAFPDIQKLSADQRKAWYIIDDYGFSFDDCEEVYHIEQILGKYADYKYHFLPVPESHSRFSKTHPAKADVNEPSQKYERKK